MNLLAAALSMSVAGLAPALAQEERRARVAPSVTAADVEAVSPVLARHLRGTLLGEVWSRPGMSARDRSVVTVAALVARNQATEMPFYFGRALDSGVTPAELSEIIAHLAWYSGFPNAVSAVAAARDVFAERGVEAEQLPAASPEPLPQDEAAEAARHRSVSENVGPVSQGVVDYTDMLFDDVWRRPGLAPRDRSLVTLSALVVSGQSAQVTFHLNRAMDNGLTREEVSETLTQLAFYGGWPNVMSAVPVVKDVLAKRGG
ncbi:4-carboxymuconolactone decarboxylase [Aureimonas endophytica]|uniref:4-carboxymuconolactone decarboxylase n=1 Tax=Aureimonas endophytica TaxID=2027858 RepID=A0A916ZKE2_9HYPH|nr:carboxymuconolactone decarboxylase family protein [Aureimonas endophytica]GGE02261.1 4-carboxymuconolactone decarboxylase [Aureimonas endophytica]